MTRDQYLATVRSDYVDGHLVKKVQQEPDRLSKEQRDIEHMMRCRKAGCVRCT